MSVANCENGADFENNVIAVKSESGGVTHYSLVRDPSVPDLPAPTTEFRDFVRRLGEVQISTAVALGQFQRAVERTLKSTTEGTHSVE